MGTRPQTMAVEAEAEAGGITLAADLRAEPSAALGLKGTLRFITSDKLLSSFKTKGKVLVVPAAEVSATIET